MRSSIFIESVWDQFVSLMLINPLQKQAFECGTSPRFSSSIRLSILSLVKFIFLSFIEMVLWRGSWSIHLLCFLWCGFWSSLSAYFQIMYLLHQIRKLARISLYDHEHGEDILHFFEKIFKGFSLVLALGWNLEFSQRTDQI